ncbi:MAG: BON domain-containing protein [Betaproteobacteria bacterium]
MSNVRVRHKRTGAVTAGALIILLSACDSGTSSSVPVVQADLQMSPVSKTGAQRGEARAQPPTVEALVAQARAQPETPVAPSATQPAAQPEPRPALPKQPPAAGKPSSRPASDADLASRVKTAVLAQPLSALMFNVSVSNGIVTLSGTADNVDTREKAGRAAADVEGVRSVNNRISVLSGS